MRSDFNHSNKLGIVDFASSTPSDLGRGLIGEVEQVIRLGAGDPKRFRMFAVISRQAVIDSRFSTVICAPVYTERYGLSTEVPLDAEHGLKRESSIYCDALVSVPKSALTRFVGALPTAKLGELDRAIAAAADLDLDALCIDRA